MRWSIVARKGNGELSAKLTSWQVGAQQATPLSSIRVRRFVQARGQECGCAMKVKALVFPGKFLGSGVYGDAFEDFADLGG